MFELFSGDRRRAPHRGALPVLVSTVAHVIAIGGLLAIPILYVSVDVPEVPDKLPPVSFDPWTASHVRRDAAINPIGKSMQVASRSLGRPTPGRRPAPARQR